LGAPLVLAISERSSEQHAHSPYIERLVAKILHH
jgi:hypothetical protein